MTLEEFMFDELGTLPIGVIVASIGFYLGMIIGAKYKMVTYKGSLFEDEDKEVHKMKTREEIKKQLEIMELANTANADYESAWINALRWVLGE